MPNMVDPYFSKSVIFICEDDKNGTMGIIVNKPISKMKVVSSGVKNKIFEDILNESDKIYFGGPVNLNEACIVQKNTGKADDFSEKIELSTNLDLIQEILFNEKTPKDTIRYVNNGVNTTGTTTSPFSTSTSSITTLGT